MPLVQFAGVRKMDAECLAMSRAQRMFKVILPQAIRIATPPTVGFSVQIIKNTSLASVVAQRGRPRFYRKLVPIDPGAR